MRKESKKDLQIISLQLPKELVAELKSDAENNLLSMSAFIRNIILKYYKDLKSHE